MSYNLTELDLVLRYNLDAAGGVYNPKKSLEVNILKRERESRVGQSSKSVPTDKSQPSGHIALAAPSTEHL